MDRQCTVL